MHALLCSCPFAGITNDTTSSVRFLCSSNWPVWTQLSMRYNSLCPVCSIYLPLCHSYQSPMALSLSFTEDQTSHRPPEGLGTGSSHLAVVIIFYGTIIFIYLQPARSSSKNQGLHHSHSTLKPHYLYSKKQRCELRLENTGNETPSWFRADMN